MRASNQLIKTSLVVSSLCISLLVISEHSVAAEEECEATVDMADSLDFHRMHMGCNKDKKRGGGKKSTTLENEGESNVQRRVVQEAGVQSSNVQSSSVQNVSAQKHAPQEKEKQTVKIISASRPILEAVEPFSLTGGPESAQLGLFKQMAAKCPEGWEKHQETVRPAEQGFYLSYRFSCL